VESPANTGLLLQLGCTYMDFPHIKEVYRQQAEFAKEHYIGYLSTAIGALLIVLLWGASHYSTNEPWALLDIIVFGVLGLVIVSAIAVSYISIKRGLRGFDAVWERQLESEVQKPEALRQFERLEQDLALGSIRFKNVVLSNHHLVFFDTIRNICQLSEIELIGLEELHIVSGSNLRMMGRSPIYAVGCYISGNGYQLLSSDPDEMRDLISELRKRRPDLLFSKEAFAYFFPLKQALIDEQNVL
jgi:hypothetical protein